MARAELVEDGWTKIWVTVSVHEIDKNASDCRNGVAQREHEQRDSQEKLLLRKLSFRLLLEDCVDFVHKDKVDRQKLYTQQDEQYRVIQAQKRVHFHHINDDVAADE